MLDPPLPRPTLRIQSCLHKKKKKVLGTSEAPPLSTIITVLLNYKCIDSNDLPCFGIQHELSQLGQTGSFFDREFSKFYLEGQMVHYKIFPFNTQENSVLGVLSRKRELRISNLVPSWSENYFSRDTYNSFSRIVLISSFDLAVTMSILLHAMKKGTFVSFTYSFVNRL